MSKINLSYNGMKDYIECPKRYKLQYIDRLKPKEPENKKNAFFGTLCANVTEHWINSRIYKEQPEAWGEWLKMAIPRESTKILEREYIVWDTDSELEEFIELSYRCLPKCFQTMADQGILKSDHIKAEPKLKIDYGDNIINGRLDILAIVDGEILIIDGKTSKHRDRYLDPAQLYTYYILVSTKLGDRLPIRFGFQYTRFGDIDWYDVDPKGLQDTKDKFDKAFAGIEAGVFSATPNDKICKYCKYRPECNEREVAENNRRAARSKLEYGSIDSGIINLEF